MPITQDVASIFNFIEATALTDALDDVPIVGSALTNLITALGVGDYRDAILTAISDVEALGTPGARAAAMAQAINNDVPDASATLNGDLVTIRFTRTFDAGGSTGSQTLDLSGTAAGLNAEVDFTGSIGATLDLVLEYDAANNTINYTDDSGDEISIAADFDADYEASATLGPDAFAARVEDNATTPELSATFGVDLAALNAMNVSVSTGGGLLLMPRFTLDLPTNILPDFYSDFLLEWNLATPGAPPTVSAEEIGVDLTSLLESIDFVLDPLTEFLFDGVVGSIVDLITEPIPGIDDFFDLLNLPDPVPAGDSFLGAGLSGLDIVDPFSVLLSGGDGTFNFLDLVGAYYAFGTGNSEAYRAISVFAEVLGFLALLDELSEDDSVEIALGTLAFDNAGNPGTFTPAVTDNGSPLDELASQILSNDVFTKVLDEVAGLTGGGQSGFSDVNLTDNEGITFPLFENPEQIVDILFQVFDPAADTVRIVQYDMPAQRFEGQFEVAIPIFGPFQIKLAGGAALGIDAAIGYDTFALSTGNPLSGVYLTTEELERGDWNEGPFEFEFAPLAYTDSFIQGSIALDAFVASIEAGGRINGFVGLWLPGGELDPGFVENPPPGSGFFRYQNDSGGCFFDPIRGIVTAEIFAELEFGVGFFSWSKWITIVEVLLADFTIGCPESNMIDTGLAREVDGDTILMHVGPETPNRIIEGSLHPDVDEGYTVTAVRDEMGSVIPGALAFHFKQYTQVFGDDPGEILASTVTGDFGEGDDFFKPEATLTVRFDASGGADNDALAGAAADDVLRGGSGNDELTGNAGHDMLFGDEGNDFLDGGAGADLLSGGPGFDQVKYETSTTGIDFTVEAAGPTVVFRGIAGDATGDVLRSIEHIVGSDHDDRIYGNPFVASVLEGGDGNDSLLGGADDDVLNGGAGSNLLIGGGGFDFTSYYDLRGPVRVNLTLNTALSVNKFDVLVDMEGAQGSGFDDELIGSVADELLDGFFGDDIIDGEGGEDTITGGAGDDTIFAYADVGLVDGGPGGDLLDLSRDALGIDASLSRDTAFRAGGGPELEIAEEELQDGQPDTFDRLSTFEDLTGTQADDTLEGDRGRNVLRGLNGDDLIFGDEGNDLIVGGFGGDSLFGGIGNDTADYSDGFQVSVSLALGMGFTSSAFGDVLDSIENLIGSDGSDTLVGDANDNEITSRLARGGFADSIDGGSGNDRLNVDWSRGDTGLGMTGGVDTGAFVRNTSNGLTILDSVEFSGIEEFEIRGTVRSDVIRTGGGDDFVYTGGSGDLVNAGSGVDIVLVGDDDDSVIWSYEPSRPLLMLLDGGRDIDSLDIDLGRATEDLLITADAADRVSLRTLAGGAAKNFEVLARVVTGSGSDIVIETDDDDNDWSSNSGSDILSPGLGVDNIHDGFDYDDSVAIPVAGANAYRLAPGISLDDIRNAQADTLNLDYADAGAAVRSALSRSSTGTLFYDDGVPNTSTSIRYSGTDGIYRTLDFSNELTLVNIERINVFGSGFDDVLTGAWRGSVNAFSSGFAEALLSDNHARGNDLLSGRNGDDVIIGMTGSDRVMGGAGDDTIVGPDPSLSNGVLDGSPFEPVDGFEIDNLFGGGGADLFVLGTADTGQTPGPILPQPNIFYLGRRADQTDITDARAIIHDFDVTEGDRLQLPGAPSNYIFNLEGSDWTIHVGADIVAELIDPVGFLPSNGAITFVSPTSPGWQPSDVPGLFDLVAANLVPAAALAVPTASASSKPSDQTMLMAATVPSITQTTDRDTLLTAFFADPEPEDVTSGTLRLTGDRRAFGTFVNDPFGLGEEGIVISTGRVADILGENTEDGGAYSPQQASFSFELVGEDAIGSNEVRLYRTEISDLVGGLRSFTLADADLKLTPASFTGADIDAVFLSRERATANTVSDMNAIESLDVFDYSAAGTFFEEGTTTSGAQLNGTIAGLVDNEHATLGVVDGLFQSVSLGDGGRLNFQLTEAVDVVGPLYLYVAETGEAEAVLPGLTAITQELEPLSDLSTDFGTPGPDDDTIVFDYTFTVRDFGDRDHDGGYLSFDFSLFTEELVEYAGDVSDSFSITLNGVELAQLSDGAALSISALKAATYSVEHPDLVINYDTNGVRQPGPLAEVVRADAYTVTQTFVGPLQEGRNDLVISVSDDRDGWLDSGLFLSNARIIDGLESESARGAIVPVNPIVPVREGDTRTVAVDLVAFEQAEKDVNIIFTPGKDVDIGEGPGNSKTVVYRPGDATRIFIPVTPELDQLIQVTEYKSINVSATSADVAFENVLAMPILVPVEDVSTATNDDDVILGSNQDNYIDALGGDDTLIGNAGFDTLDGGVGDDVMRGGPDDDLYRQDSLLDRIIEQTGEGVDTTHSSVSTRLRKNVEHLTLQGSAGDDLRGIGNNLDNTIRGDAGDNVLNGVTSNDTLRGLAGDDKLVDRDGGDRLVGGPGDDVYFVFGSASIVEAPGEGVDQVRSNRTAVLEENVERLALVGNAEIDGTGNAADNVISGNNAANVLSGLSGNDIIFGRGGSDSIFGGLDDDRLFGEAGLDSLEGGDGDDRIDGGFGVDSLFGGAGSDRLNGGPAQDSLTGGPGADLFIIQGAFGRDFITDFEDTAGPEGAGDGLDRLNLVALRSANGDVPLSFDQLLITQAGPSTNIRLDLDTNGSPDILDLDGDGVFDPAIITLLGFTSSDLSAADFMF